MPDSDSSTTRRLLDELRSGQAPAFDRLFERYRAYVRQVIALRMDQRLRARVDPSDIVQETQIEAFRRIDDVIRGVEAPFRLWLRQIACDRLGMAYRRHIGAARRSAEREVRLPDHSSAALARQLLAGLPSPSEQFELREAARLLRHVIAQLAEPDREILLLHNFEGLTSRESAHVLGITPAAARKRYGRALLRLRKLLVSQGLGGSQ